MTLELGSFLAGSAALAGFVFSLIRYRRLELRQDAWLAAAGALGEAETAVKETLAAHGRHVERTTQEMEAMELALSTERRRRADLEVDLVQVKAEVARVRIEYAAKAQEAAQLEARIDRLLADHPPLLDLRQPRLEDHDRES